MRIAELIPLLDLLPQSALLLRPMSGEVLHANPAARAVYGLTAADVGGNSLRDLGFDEDSSQAVDLSNLLNLAVGESACSSLSVWPKDGGYRYAAISATCLVLDEPRSGILMLVADVTPLRQLTLQAEAREETLQAIVEAHFAVCYEWDILSGRTLFWGSFDDLLGLAADETPKTIGEWLELVHPDDVSRVTEKNQASIDKGQPYRDEYRMVHRDGSHVIVTDSGHVLTDDDGNANRMVGGIRDVTHERETQRALEERNVALRVILDQGRRDRFELERNINENLRILVLPALERLRRSLGSRPEVSQLESLLQTLDEIVRPIARHPGSGVTVEDAFTPRELEIIDLVRKGKTSQEIARMLSLSPATVSYHRTNIRRKLKVPSRGRRLAAHLSALEQSDAESPADSRLMREERSRFDLGG